MEKIPEKTIETSMVLDVDLDDNTEK